MPRELTSRTGLDSLRKEAKHWLKALRANDDDARARFERALSRPPAAPTLRDVQRALAQEFGFPSWTQLRTSLTNLATKDPDRGGDVQELLAAANQGDPARVTAVIERRPDIIDTRGELPGHTGRRTALHFGVHHEPVVRCLLERGANPNIHDEGDNAMPLHFAAEKQELAIVRLLVEHGADPIGDGDLHELDVIGWATSFDYVTAQPELIDYLLASGARHNIFSAVAMGDVDSVRRLAAESSAHLDRPMDRTNHRRRPLHLAIVKKQRASLTVLLELGADTEAHDQAGLTALDQAALAGDAQLAQALIDGGAAIHLPAAIALGRTEDIDRILRQYPGSLEPGQRWGTLIVRAAERAPGPVIDTLVRLGASVDVWDDPETAVDQVLRFTPLHAAAFRGNLSAAEVLLKHGANVRVREDKYCSTPAGWANYFGHMAVRDLILQGPIDIFDAVTFDRLDRVEEIVAGDPQTLRQPFREHASCEAAWGWCTPLAVAVLQNKAGAARLLLALGAQVIHAPDGRTLHDVASEQGSEEVAQILREHSGSR